MLKNKIIIIGCPGSGKSIFARKLSEKTKITLYHLDNIYWNHDWTHLDKEVFISTLNNIMENNQWIIDGNYGSTMEERMNKCEMVFLLDYEVDVCLQVVRERFGKERDDMPCIEVKEDMELIEFIKNHSVESRPQVMKLLEKYSYKEIVIFKSREESNTYLSYL